MPRDYKSIVLPLAFTILSTLIYSEHELYFILTPMEPSSERRELIAKNLEENKERMELSQKLMLCEKECSGNLSSLRYETILAFLF